MTVLADPIAKAIRSVYEAGFSADRWRDGLSEFCNSVGAYAAIMVPRREAANTVHLPFTSEMEDLAQDFVDNRWYERDLRAMRGWPLVDSGKKILLDKDFIRPEDHRDEPFFCEFAARHDVLWWAGITFEAIGNQYCLSLHRTPRQEMFEETERRILHHVSGYLSRALTMAEQLSRATAMGGLSVLEAMEHGGILVDPQGRVIEMNDAAKAMLGDGLAVQGGRLAAQDSRSHSRMRSMIARTLLLGPQIDRFVPIRRRDKRPLMLDVMPLPQEVGSLFYFAKALVVLVDPDRRSVPTSRRLMDMFRLSTTEAAVAVRLAAGLTLQEVSDELGIGRETARTHLKSIFGKTGTNRQSHLVTLVLRVGTLP